MPINLKYRAAEPQVGLAQSRPRLPSIRRHTLVEGDLPNAMPRVGTGVTDLSPSGVHEAESTQLPVHLAWTNGQDSANEDFEESSGIGLSIPLNSLVA